MRLGLLAKILFPVAVMVGGAVYFVNTLKPTAVVAEARRSVAVRSVPGTVLVRAERAMTLRSELGGRVTLSQLELGKQVAQGELLLSLDTSELDVSIEKVKIQIEATQESLAAGSARDFERYTANEQLEELKRRRDSGNASSAEVERKVRSIEQIEKGIEREVRAMEFSLAQLENELRGLENRRSKASVVSPIDGVVSEVFVYEGDLVGAGVPIAEIISADRVVEVKVSEENFSGIAEGQLARVKFLGYGDETFSAQVKKTLPVADPETQRYTVHLDVAIDREKLFPGLTGEATITLDERPGAIVIPSSAVVGNNVFVVRDGVVALQDIRKGYSSLTSVEIREGIADGDLVIVEQLELFKMGDRVKTIASDL